MNFLRSLRARLILLVAIAIIPALGITLISGLEQRRLARQRAVDDAYRYTRVVAAYETSLVEATGELLTSLSAVQEVMDPAACGPYLRDLYGRNPLYRSVMVTDPTGRLVCASSDPGLQTLGGQEFFLQALLQPGWTVGSPQVISEGKPGVLPVALPARDGNGRVERVLVAWVGISSLMDFTTTLDLPPQSALLMVDRDGRVVARFPETERWVGLRLPDAPIIRAILGGQGEGSAEAAGLDGVQRLYAFTPFYGGPRAQSFISIGIPSGLAYASAERLLRQNLLWLGLAAALAFLFAWFGGEIFFLRVVSLTAERDAAENRLREINAGLEARVAERTEELADANRRLQVELAERQRTVAMLRQREVELSRAMRQLERSNRDLQDFAFITSHDLQEPLRKVQAFGGRLAERYQDQLGEEGGMFVRRMVAAAGRMQTMINDLLAYSRVSTQRQAFTTVDLNQAAAEVIGDLELRMRDTHGAVQVEDLPTVQADPLQVRQLLQNLIGNALKFHRPDVPPLVRVSARLVHADAAHADAARADAAPADGRASSSDGQLDCPAVVLRVEDNGIGFDEKYVGRIFQPFQRLHSKDQYEGSGIGLAICKRIAERHGGSISASSTPGQGSCFEIILPIQPPAEETQSYAKT